MKKAYSALEDLRRRRARKYILLQFPQNTVECSVRNPYILKRHGNTSPTSSGLARKIVRAAHAVPVKVFREVTQTGPAKSLTDQPR